jgi:LmbE family N-acetylglucosaminyl deacetylase
VDDQYLPLPEDWDRALVVVAHPDDMEYGGSGAVARWTAQGREVAYLLVTRGEAGIDTMDPGECARVREAEQRAACAAVGVTAVEFLDHPDGLVEYGLPLRRDVAAAIRRHRPEMLVISNHRETWGGGALNQADHVHTGRAAIDAVRDAANRWIFPGAGGDPWDGVRSIAVSASPLATHAVDITATIDRAVASLRAHRAYLDALGGPMGDPDTFLRGAAAEAGARLPGAELATVFELLEP